jgi:hypothetical protein
MCTIVILAEISHIYAILLCELQSAPVPIANFTNVSASCTIINAGVDIFSDKETSFSAALSA